MKSDEIREKLIDYCDGKLSPAEKKCMDERFAQDSALYAEYKALAGISEKLKTIPPVDVPSEKLRSQFQIMITEEKQKDNSIRKEEPDSREYFQFKRYFLRFGYTAAVLAIGILFGMQLNNGLQPGDRNAEMAALRTQIADMNQLVTHSLLQQKSTSERMEIVLATLAQGQINRQLLTDLVGTLAFDPSMNVRLSALEALAPYANEELVRAGLHAALPKEDAPLVQIAMIELLVQTKDMQSVPILEKLHQNNAVDSNVRVTAKRALGILSTMGQENNIQTETIIL